MHEGVGIRTFFLLRPLPSALARNLFSVSFLRKKTSISFVAGQPLVFLLASFRPVPPLVWAVAELVYPGIRLTSYAMRSQATMSSDTERRTATSFSERRTYPFTLRGKAMNPLPPTIYQYRRRSIKTHDYTYIRRKLVASDLCLTTEKSPSLALALATLVPLASCPDDRN